MINSIHTFFSYAFFDFTLYTIVHFNRVILLLLLLLCLWYMGIQDHRHRILSPKISEWNCAHTELYAQLMSNKILSVTSYLHLSSVRGSLSKYYVLTLTCVFNFNDVFCKRDNSSCTLLSLYSFVQKNMLKGKNETFSLGIENDAPDNTMIHISF